MNLKKVLTAEATAKEFLKRAKHVRETAQNDSMLWYGSKETSALKRQSMELTRALSELRKAE